MKGKKTTTVLHVCVGKTMYVRVRYAWRVRDSGRQVDESERRGEGEEREAEVCMDGEREKRQRCACHGE